MVATLPGAWSASPRLAPPLKHEFCPPFGRCHRQRSTLVGIEESDLDFLACPQYRYSQPNSKLNSAVHYAKGTGSNGTGNSKVVQRREGIWLSQSRQWRRCLRSFLGD